VSGRRRQAMWWAGRSITLNPTVLATKVLMKSLSSVPMRQGATGTS
jgi:hypothetical protein